MKVTLEHIFEKWINVTYSPGFSSTYHLPDVVYNTLLPPMNHLKQYYYLVSTDERIELRKV